MLAISLVGLDPSIGRVVFAAFLLAQAGGGLHWLPFAFALAVTIAASNAWILLVEVLR